MLAAYLIRQLERAARADRGYLAGPMRRLRVNVVTLLLWCVATGLAIAIAAQLVDRAI